MKKILNWTFGACFRTIGRFLAIFIVGALLIFIGSKLGFKLDSILPMKVNASETWIGNVKYGINSYYIYDLSANSFTNKDYEIGSVSRYSNTDKIYWYQNSAAMTIGNNGIMSAYNISQRTLSGYLYQLTFYACSNKRIYYANTNADIFVGGKAGDVASRPANSVSYQATNITELLATDANYCAMYTTLFVPNTTTNGSWVGLRLRASGSNITGLYFTAFGYDIQQLGLYDKTIEEIIQNSGFATSQSVEEVHQSVNQVEQEIQQTNDTITNEDITGANDSANGFFNNFQDNDFGLSSIITAPLRAINSMLNDTCVAPSATYKGQSFSFPCGSMLWSREGGQDFRNFLNIFYGGFLVYFVIRSLFLDIEKLKNPNNDKVEVEKL